MRKYKGNLGNSSTLNRDINNYITAIGEEGGGIQSAHVGSKFDDP